MENLEQKFENKEVELKKYTYVDGNENRKVVFECLATDILEADKLYTEKTGKNPEKQNNILVSIEFKTEEK